MSDVVGLRIGVKMTQEEQLSTREKYISDGWREAPVYSRLSFVSPGGDILHAYDVDSGQLTVLDLGWLESVRDKKECC